MSEGTAFQVVLGGDRPITRTLPYSPPRVIPTGLDWAKHTAPVEVIPDPAPKAPEPTKIGAQRNQASRVKPGPHTGRSIYVDAVVARLTALGVTSGQIRDWADKAGVPYHPRGLISRALIDAYEEAHQ